MFTLNRRLALISLGAAAALSLAGCASLNSVTADAQSFDSWPAARQAGSFAFERLPSQQRDPDGQSSLEGAARAALLKAGFTEDFIISVPKGAAERIQVELVSQSSMFADDVNLIPVTPDGQRGRIDGWTQVNAAVSYGPPQGNWEVFLSARNLFDRLYIVDRARGGAKPRWTPP